MAAARSRPGLIKKARALLVAEFFDADITRFIRGKRRKRDAIRGVTLMDAPPAPLTFSMDDYRDVCLGDMRVALAWMGRVALRAPAARRLRAVEATLAVLHQNPPRRGKSVSSVLGSSVLEGWPQPARLHIAALLFETGILRDPRQLDGAVWYSGKRNNLRLHVPTVERLFPGLDLKDPAAGAVRTPPLPLWKKPRGKKP